jgi:hypothetical protein
VHADVTIPDLISKRDFHRLAESGTQHQRTDQRMWPSCLLGGERQMDLDVLSSLFRRREQRLWVRSLHARSRPATLPGQRLDVLQDWGISLQRKDHAVMIVIALAVVVDRHRQRDDVIGRDLQLRPGCGVGRFRARRDIIGLWFVHARLPASAQQRCTDK